MYIPACSYFLSFFFCKCFFLILVNFYHFFAFFIIKYSVVGAAGDAAVGGLSSLAGLGIFKYFAGGMSF